MNKNNCRKWCYSAEKIGSPYFTKHKHWKAANLNNCIEIVVTAQLKQAEMAEKSRN
jgi:hypothetical protein